LYKSFASSSTTISIDSKVLAGSSVLGGPLIMTHSSQAARETTISETTTSETTTSEPKQQLRPILHHLNADSSWLLQIPIPSNAVGFTPYRRFCNILIDPWLQGPQSDVAFWFSRQWHAEESSVQSVKEALLLALRAETAGDQIHREQEQGAIIDNAIDLVVVSHEFTDHCHKDTLLEVASTVAVLAPPKAAALIRDFDHFDRVVDIEPSPSRPAAEAALPPWLNITRIENPSDALYYHSAVVISFKDETQDREECVIYTPHGVAPEAIAMLKDQKPLMQALCLIHGLHDVWLTMTQQLNLGGHNGLQVQRALKSKYWVGTHDEVKIGGGLVKWFLNRKIITFNETLREESEKLKEKGDRSLEDVHFEDIDNGASKILV